MLQAEQNRWAKAVFGGGSRLDPEQNHTRKSAVAVIGSRCRRPEKVTTVLELIRYLELAWWLKGVVLVPISKLTGGKTAVEMCELPAYHIRHVGDEDNRGLFARLMILLLARRCQYWSALSWDAAHYTGIWYLGFHNASMFYFT